MIDLLKLNSTNIECKNEQHRKGIISRYDLYEDTLKEMQNMGFCQNAIGEEEFCNNFSSNIIKEEKEEKVKVKINNWKCNNCKFINPNSEFICQICRIKPRSLAEQFAGPELLESAPLTPKEINSSWYPNRKKEIRYF